MTCPDGVSGNVRLVGFDAPESHEPRCRAEADAGLRAKNALRSFVDHARAVSPDFQGTDRYGRPLIRLYLDGRDAAGLMVQSGNGVYYTGGRRINWCARLA